MSTGPGGFTWLAGGVVLAAGGVGSFATGGVEDEIAGATTTVEPEGGAPAARAGAAEASVGLRPDAVPAGSADTGAEAVVPVPPVDLASVYPKAATSPTIARPPAPSAAPRTRLG